MSGRPRLFRSGTLLRIVEETVKAVTPHVLGIGAVEEFPDADPQASVDFLGDWHEKGIPEFRVVSTIAFLLLNLCSLVVKARLFPRLDYDSQAALFGRLCESKNRLADRFLYFLAMPAVSAYYARIDVQALLGFDIPALKEESERRLVTRDGGPLPPRDAAPHEGGEFPGEGEG